MADTQNKIEVVNQTTSDKNLHELDVVLSASSSLTLIDTTIENSVFNIFDLQECLSLVGFIKNDDILIRRDGVLLDKEQSLEAILMETAYIDAVNPDAVVISSGKVFLQSAQLLYLQRKFLYFYKASNFCTGRENFYLFIKRPAFVNSV